MRFGGISNRQWLKVHQLPAYCPELNPTERLRQHTRKAGTHNRFFMTVAELAATVTRVFADMQRYPILIEAYLAPFCCLLCPFSYARMYSITILLEVHPLNSVTAKDRMQ